MTVIEDGLFLKSPLQKGFREWVLQFTKSVVQPQRFWSRRYVSLYLHILLHYNL